MRSRMPEYCFCLVTALVLGAGCGSPFFPETGIPLRNVSLRETPAGVVRQLVVSYENRRSDLFEELLYSNEDFRFYIEPDENILAELANIKKDQTDDVALQSGFIVDGKYTYLTYNEELRSHRNLFTKASEITFVGLQVDSVLYFSSLDSVDATALPDSTGANLAVVRTDAAEIRISAQEISDEYGETSHVFPVGRQLFFLKKDSEGLWRILLWFELDVPYS